MFSRKNSIAVIFDDHRLFADSFGALIERLDIFQSVFVFADEKELTQFFVKRSVIGDVCFFVDYLLNDKHSIPIINDARRLNRRIKVIVVSSILDAGMVQNVLAYNPDGFLSKSAGFSETLECVRAIEEGKTFVSPVITNLLDQATQIPVQPFTGRELELLQYFNQGLSIAGTAEKVNLSRHTVVAHRRHMMEKADCRSIAELLAFSRKRGLI